MPEMTEEEKAELASRRGKIAAGIKDPEKQRAFIARQGEQEAKRESLEGVKKETETEEAYKAAGAPSMAKGGKVKKSGVYKLHKGEAVIPVGDAKGILGGKKSKPKSKKRGKGMRIKKATSGGYIAEPEYDTQPGEQLMEPESHVHPDIESLIAHLKDHFSEDEGSAHEAAESPEFEAGEQEGRKELGRGVR